MVNKYIMSEENKWPFFSKRLSERLEKKEITLYRLEEDTRDREIKLRSSNMSKVKAGKKRPTDDILKALSEYQPLDLTLEELKGWRAIDEVGIDAIFEVYRRTHLDSVITNAGETTRRVYVEGIELIPCQFFLQNNKLIKLSTDNQVNEYSVFPFLENFPKSAFCIKVKDDSQWPPIAKGAEILACEAHEFKHLGWYLISDELSMPAIIRGEDFDPFSVYQFHFAEFDQNEDKIRFHTSPPQLLDAKHFDLKKRIAYEILIYRVIKNVEPSYRESEPHQPGSTKYSL